MKQNLSKKYKYFRIATLLLIAICTAAMSGLITYSLVTMQNPSMSGTVNFTATGVNATVAYDSTNSSGITFTNGTPTTLEYSTSKTVDNEAAEATWTGMTVSIGPSTTATLKFTITKTGTDDLYALVSASESADWLKITVDTCTESTSIDADGTTVTVTFAADNMSGVSVDTSTTFTISVTLSTSAISG